MMPRMPPTPSPFTRMVAGEIPARILDQDDACFALLAGSPVRPGHSVVVPREEIDDWLDVPPELMERVLAMARRVAVAVRSAFPCDKVALVIAGIETRHAHLHLVPIDAVAQLDFQAQDRNPDPRALDAAAAAIRRELQR